MLLIKFLRRLLFLALCFFIGSGKANAQFYHFFPLTNTSNAETTNNGQVSLVLDGSSTLTYQNNGPDYQPVDNDSGWLRLTNLHKQEKGWAYLDQAFSNTLGVYVDFEFKFWGPANYNELADGLSVFLYDGSIASKDFKIGPPGGALCYAYDPKYTDGSTAPVSGGYLGVGLDQYGNFSSPQLSNTLVIRGKSANNTPYIKGVSQYFNGTGLAGTYLGYQNVSARPPDSTYYRRVRYYLIPLYGNGANNAPTDFKITVDLKTSTGGTWYNIIANQLLNQGTPPSMFKLGFGASTGAYMSNHEVRNLTISTPMQLSSKITVDAVAAENDQIVHYKNTLSNSGGFAVNAINPSNGSGLLTIAATGVIIDPNSIISLNKAVLNANGVSMVYSGTDSAGNMLYTITNFPINTTINLAYNGTIRGLSGTLAVVTSTITPPQNFKNVDPNDGKSFTSTLITDNPSTLVTLMLSPSSVCQGEAVSLTASLPSGFVSGYDTVVQLTPTAVCSAGLGTDYVFTQSSITIPAGQNSASAVVLNTLPRPVVNTAVAIALAGAPIVNPSGKYYVASSNAITLVYQKSADMVLGLGSSVVLEGQTATVSLSLANGVTTGDPLTVTVWSTNVSNGGNFLATPFSYVVGQASSAGSTSFTVVIPSGANGVSFGVQTKKDGSYTDNVFGLSASVSTPSGVYASCGGSYAVSGGMLTVTNMDGFTVTLSLSPNTVCGAGTVSLTASLPNGSVSGYDTVVQLTPTAGTSAVLGTDYVFTQPSITIPAGQNSASVILLNTLPRAVINRAVTIGVSDSGVNNLGGIYFALPSNAITLVYNKPSDMVLGLGSSTVSEGQTATLSLSLANGVITGSPLTVTIWSTNVSNGGNFLTTPFSYIVGQAKSVGSTSFTVVIPSGSNGTSFSVQTKKDGGYNDNIFGLSASVSAPSGVYASCGGSYVVSRGTLTVTNMDGVPVKLSLSPSIICDAGPVSLTASLPSGFTSGYDTVVQLTPTSGMSAVSGTDYVFTQSSITIPAGQNSVSLVVMNTLPRAVINRAVTIGVSGSGVTNLGGMYSAVSSTPITLVYNKPSDMVLGLGSSTVSEGQTATLSLSLANGVITGSPLTVTIWSTNVSNGGNFLTTPFSYIVGQAKSVGSTSFTVVIPSGSNGTSFSVQTKKDGGYNDNIFGLNASVSAPSGVYASCGGSYVVSRGTLTVTNMDVIPVKLSLSPSIICDAGPVSLTASLPSGFTSGYDTVVQLTPTSGMSAVLGTDYAFTQPSITIPAGQNSVSLVVMNTLSRAVINRAVTIGVSGSGVTNLGGMYSAVSSTPITLVYNKPSDMVLGLGSSTVSEGQTATLSLSLANGVITGSPLTVTIWSTNVSNGGNFLTTPFSYVVGQAKSVGSTSFTVVIPSGSNGASFSVQTKKDGGYNDNIFGLSASVSAPSGAYASCGGYYAVGGGTLTVTNMDLVPIILAFSPTTATVGDVVSLIASITSLAPSAVTDVFISMSTNGLLTTAIDGLNFSSLSSDIKIGQGAWLETKTPFLVPLDSHCIGGSSVLTLSGLLPSSLSKTYVIINQPSVTIINPTNPSDLILDIDSGTISAGAAISLSIALPNSVNTAGLSYTVTTCKPLTLTITPSRYYPSSSGNFLVSPFTYTLYDKSNAAINSVINGYNSSFNVTIPAGANATYFTVLSTVDLTSYHDNAFLLRGTTAASGYTIHDGELTVTNTRIIPISITFVDKLGAITNVVYGNDQGTSPAYLLASLPSGVVAMADLKVDLSSAVASSAISGTDYLHMQPSITIPAGSNSASITIFSAKNRKWLGLSTTVYLNCTIANDALSRTYQVGSMSPMTYIVDTTDQNPDNRIAIVSSGTVKAGLSATLNVSLTNSLKTALTLTFTLNPSSISAISSVLVDGVTQKNAASFTVIIPAESNASYFVVNTFNNGSTVDVTYSISGTSQIKVVNGFLTVLAVDQAPPIVVSSVVGCEGGFLGLSATQSLSNGASPTYNWTGPNNFNLSTQESLITVSSQASPSIAGSYRVVTTANGYNPSPPSFISVTINPIPVVDAGGDITLVSGNRSTKIKSEAHGVSLTYLWTPSDYLDNNQILQPVVTIPEGGLKPLAGMSVKYKFEAFDVYGCMSLSYMAVHVPLFVPNAFTPNGDGENDNWVIDQIGQYPSCIVNVYTRWGASIYKSLGYSVPWDGACQSGPCEAAVYYYLIDLKGDGGKIGGYVSIIR